MKFSASFIFVNAVVDNYTTVVPVLGNPRPEWPPDMYGHVINVPKHHNVKLPVIGDTCRTRTRTVIYWLSVPVITDSSNTYCVFGGDFNPKSLAARTLGCHQQFAQIPILPSGDRKQCFISQTLWLHSFYDITSSALNPRCRRRERFLVLTSAHRVEHVLSQ